MKLTIVGAPKGAGVNQTLLRKASNYYGNILMRDDLTCLQLVKVELHIVEGLQADYNATGFCHWTDRPINPMEFLIELDAGLKYKTSLISLAHEFVHLKQLAFGEKQLSLDGTKTRWMGMLLDHETVHYYDQPWEIEALGREYGLYDRFVAEQQGVKTVIPALVDDESKLRSVA